MAKYTLKSKKDNSVIITTPHIFVAINYIGLLNYKETHYIKITKDKTKYDFEMFQEYVKKNER